MKRRCVSMSASAVISVEEAKRAKKVPWLPILMYHRVVDRLEGPDPYRLCVTTTEFEAQMKYLRDRGYQSISLDDAASGIAQQKLPWSKPVVITFDDGYMDNHTHAFPILRKYRQRATVMLVSSHIGRSNVWDQEDCVEGVPLLGMDEIREMGQSGISFGSHTVSHRSMPELDYEDAWRELVDSKAALEELLGYQVRTFCFPYGRSTPALSEMVRQAGYAAACGIEQRQHTLFNLSRVNPARTRRSWLIWQMKVSGVYYRILQNRGSRWLVDLVRGRRR